MFGELSGVVGKNLKQELYESLDRHCPQLVEIIRSKRGLKGQILDGLLNQTKSRHRTLPISDVLRGLPVLFDDNPTDFFKACFVTDDEDSYRHVPFGILCFTQNDVAQHPLSPSSVGIILEDNLDNLPQAMSLLFGLTCTALELP